MSSGTSWEPPDIRARRPADPNLYSAYPPPGFQPGLPPGAHQPRPPMPGSVRGAVRLMWLATILTALQAVVDCSAAASATGFDRRIYSVSGCVYVQSTGFRTGQSAVAVLMVSGLLFCGLWLWMLTMCRLGRDWARTTASVFFAVSAVAATGLVQAGVSGFDRFMGVTITLLGLMIVILLWTADSKPYFRPALVQGAWGYPGYPGYSESYPGHQGYQGHPSRQGSPQPGAGNPYRR